MADGPALIGVLLLGGLIRLGWLQRLQIPPESDYATFYDMARLIASGQWCSTCYGWLFGGPAYPLLLAPIVALLPVPLPALGRVNALLQMLMIVLVWRLARRHLGTDGGLIAAAAAAVLPGLWLYVPVLAAEHQALPLIVLIPLLLADGVGCGRLLAVGAAVGWLGLTRPAYLPFAVALAGLTVVARPGAWRLLRPAWFAVGLLLTVGPIITLNANTGGAWLPGGAAGFQLWLVNNERASGAWFDYTGADSPFRGMDALPDGDAWAQSAEHVLALEYVVANPVAALRGLASRHVMNWGSDNMGVYWTLERVPTQVSATDHDGVLRLTELSYVVLMALAAVGTWRLPAAARVWLCWPVAYMVGVYAVAEGNGRYHLLALPLLCVLAAGALVGGWSRRAWLARILGLGVVVASVQITNAPAWLVLVVAAGSATPLRSLLAPARHALRRWPWLLALPVLAVALGLALTASLNARVQADLRAVDPSGWMSEDRSPDGSRLSAPLTIIPSDVPASLQRVSYPDLARTEFVATPVPGEALALSRTLTDLRPGARYLVYLQVRDPSVHGDHSESLAVFINSREVWRRWPTPEVEEAWRYVAVPWFADSTEAVVRVERRAGAHPELDVLAPLDVRSLHVYPRY